jgi:hypothetical protein
MHTVRQQLEQPGLAQYGSLERNAAGRDLLREVTDEDLEKLGVYALGHRKNPYDGLVTQRAEATET